MVGLVRRVRIGHHASMIRRPVLAYGSPILIGALIGTLIGACSPVQRPAHCVHQRHDPQQRICGPQQICTNSQCPELVSGRPDDLGCRLQEDVFRVAQDRLAHERWGVWQECLFDLSRDQREVMRRIRSGQGMHKPDSSGKTGGEAGPEASIVPDLEPGCPQGESSGVPGTGTPSPTGENSTSGVQDQTGPGWCDRDKDCSLLPSSPYCDQAERRCQPCVLGANHCRESEKSFCGEYLGQRSCEACFQDIHCSSTGRGAHCRIRIDENEEYEPRCVACAKDEHCAKVPARPFCELPANDMPPRCVACIQDSDCGNQQFRCRNHVCLGCQELQSDCHPGATCWAWPDTAGECSRSILYVDATGRADCLLGDGSRARPFCHLHEALGVVRAGELTTIWVDGDQTLSRGLVIHAGMHVQILSHTRSLLVLNGSDENLFRITGGAKVTLAHLDLRASSNHALVCSGKNSRLQLVDSTIQGGSGHGVMIDQCQLRARRLQVLGKEGYGLWVRGAHTVLDSSMIAGNGQVKDDHGGGIYLGEDARVELRHVTLAGNHAASASAVAHCEGSSARLSIQDSIVAQGRAAKGISCSDAALSSLRTWSDIEALTVRDGAKMKEEDSLIRIARDPTQHDYRLKDPLVASPEVEVISKLGRWRPGESTYDLDGHRWVQGEGFVGADQGKFARPWGPERTKARGPGSAQAVQRR